MLVNGKIEELKKYSKNTYDKHAFVEEVKSQWDLTDLQIRMTYLVSDLAVKAEGVFSIAYNTFVDMFERRFNIQVSLSSVRRFFGLLSKIGVLSVNAAKRKNNKQSANIYIVEPIHKEITKETHEHPEEQAYEHPEEHHNIPLTKPLTKPLKNNNNNLVNKEQVTNDKIINKLISEFRLKGLSKELCFRVLKEVEANPDIDNFGAYFKACLANTLHKSQIKHGLIMPYERFKEKVNDSNVPLINWLEWDSLQNP